MESTKSFWTLGNLYLRECCMKVELQVLQSSKALSYWNIQRSMSKLCRRRHAFPILSGSTSYIFRILCNITTLWLVSKRFLLKFKGSIKESDAKPSNHQFCWWWKKKCWNTRSYRKFDPFISQKIPQWVNFFFEMLGTFYQNVHFPSKVFSVKFRNYSKYSIWPLQSAI